MRGGGKTVTPGKMLQKQLRDLVWLLRGELYLLRLSWFWYLFHMALSPLLYMFLLYLFGGRGWPEVTLFVVSGSLARGLTTASMLTLGQNIGSLKDQHAFEYYAALPISRVAFLLATATRAALFSLPSFLTILCVGTLTLQLLIRLSLLILPVVLLAGYCLAGLGAFIGFYSRSWGRTWCSRAASVGGWNGVLVLLFPFAAVDLIARNLAGEAEGCGWFSGGQLDPTGL